MSGDTQLSNDELRLIFRHLPVSDLGRCMLVSKQWKNALLEEDGADEETSVWRLKYEERWWSPLRNQCNYLEYFRGTVQNDRELAEKLLHGRMVQDCETRSWLLTGHSKRVKNIFRL